MIGVVSNPDEIPVVREFFQLFKTPWELFRAGRSYDVVIATAAVVPEVDAKLLLIFQSEIIRSDAELGINGGAKVRTATLDCGGTVVPSYGETLTFQPSGAHRVCVTAGSAPAGLRIDSPEFAIRRLGYNLFKEVGFLLSVGQPVEKAHIPSLELHINILRKWILDSGIRLVEIPPVPAGHDFMVCLTHDIDFIGIRQHKFDHTMWGFLYRSTVGSIQDFLRHRISATRLIRIWKAVASLPFVYLGWIKDFWIPFDWFLRVEKGLSPTYFLIPFKSRPGEKLTVAHPERRATAYDVTDLSDWTPTLIKEGCEIGVHGIDAWHSIEKGREEFGRIAHATGQSEIGIRMHWLLRDEETYRVLEESGYTYDSTAGYNETVGYRNGTSQTFCPPGSRNLLELPMHIQDGALFYRQRLDLSEADAWKRCDDLITDCTKLGGVLTVLWHDRSHGPERFWGEFYESLVRKLQSLNPWFGTAGRVVNWFRRRREVIFQEVEPAHGRIQVKLFNPGPKIEPPLRVRVYTPNAIATGINGSREHGWTSVDFFWTGENDRQPEEFLEQLARISQPNLNRVSEQPSPV
jgi:hypothetical protein